MHFVYILYSPSTDRFYVGESNDLSKRLIWHNSGVFKHSSTRMAKDWELYWSHDCGTIKTARRVERHIKKMKSRKYYNDLKLFPTIIEKLLGSLPR